MSDGQLPEPLVTADVNLRGYEYMPLYGDRLFKSETWKKASYEARCAMLRLWWHSFAHETPASSLPDDDVLLADYAGYGDNVKPWMKVRGQALRHWRKCSDGRLYHPVLAEFAMEAFALRTTARAKGTAGASKRWEKHRQGKAVAGASPPGSSGSATATENDSKEGKGKERKGGLSTASTRVPEGQPIKSFPSNSTPSETIAANREKGAQALKAAGMTEDDAARLLKERRT